MKTWSLGLMAGPKKKRIQGNHRHPQSARMALIPAAHPAQVFNSVKRSNLAVRMAGLPAQITAGLSSVPWSKNGRDLLQKIPQAGPQNTIGTPHYLCRHRQYLFPFEVATLCPFNSVHHAVL
jgi:hypothetical protein